MSIQMPKVRTTYLPLGGGLDLMTPAISMPSGRTFDSRNYEPEISGGYRRINGYERFDGRPSPTDNAKYVVVRANLTADVPVGMEIRGKVTGTLGTMVAKELIEGNLYKLVVANVDLRTEQFAANEDLEWADYEPFNQGEVGAVAPVWAAAGKTTTASHAEELPESDAYYTLLAANELRWRIKAVPGTGPIRAVFSLGEIIYALRDQGTLADSEQYLYQATTGGWQRIQLGREMQFKDGLTKITEGSVINNGAGVTATVGKIVVRKGSWTSTDPAEGTIIFSYNTLAGGDWAANQNIQIGSTVYAKAVDASSDITRKAGGRVELVKHRFPGRKGPQVIYGADEKNLPFEFNGPYYVPIRIGIEADTTDRPKHLAVHANHLILAVGSSIFHPNVDDPYSLQGANSGEINVGDEVTGMLPMTGGNQAPALAVFTKSMVKILYGAGRSTFRLQLSVGDAGYASYTMQPISGTGFGLTARGLQTLSATEKFGDFTFSSISAQVQPLINSLRGKNTCSVVLKNKNQYRVYFDDDVGTCLTVGLTGEEVTAIMPLAYYRPVRCIWTETFADGKERTFFGSDNGYVYEDNKGTSFDGEAIEAWIRLAFNHQRSPNVRKRFRRMLLEAKVEKFARVLVTYDFGYGNPDVSPPPLPDKTRMIGGGGYWDSFTWDSFVWDAQTVVSHSLPLEGTEKNISVVFYSKEAADSPHTLQGVIYTYSERRAER